MGAITLKDEKLSEYESENALIAKAIEFAIEKHGSVKNKDSTIG